MLRRIMWLATVALIALGVSACTARTGGSLTLLQPSGEVRRVLAPRRSRCSTRWSGKVRSLASKVHFTKLSADNQR